MKKNHNIFEIHCIKIRELHRSLTYQLIKADDKTYIYHPAIAHSIPKIDCKMIFICHKNKNNIYEVHSIFNITDGTKIIQNKLMRMFFGFIGLMTIVPFFLIVPFVLDQSQWGYIFAAIALILWIALVIWQSSKSYIDYKDHKEIIKTILSFDVLKDTEILKENLHHYDVKIFISDDF
jgi:hypothetical protein